MNTEKNLELEKKEGATRLRTLWIWDFCKIVVVRYYGFESLSDGKIFPQFNFLLSSECVRRYYDNYSTFLVNRKRGLRLLSKFMVCTEDMHINKCMQLLHFHSFSPFRSAFPFFFFSRLLPSFDCLLWASMHHFQAVAGCLIPRVQVIQGVPTSLGYAKCNVLKIRKVCERSELRLQKDPI